MTVELVSPVPPAWLPQVWEWLHEARSMNFDDTGPKAVEDLAQHLQERITWGALVDAQPSGLIGYQAITDRLGMLAGVCFRQAVCGTGAPYQAMQLALNCLWSTGVEKISAMYFADNAKIRRFLQKFGAEDEGMLRAHTVRDGQVLDMRLVAIFRERG